MYECTIYPLNKTIRHWGRVSYPTLPLQEIGHWWQDSSDKGSSMMINWKWYCYACRTMLRLIQWVDKKKKKKMKMLCFPSSSNIVNDYVASLWPYWVGLGWGGRVTGSLDTYMIEFFSLWNLNRNKEGWYWGLRQSTIISRRLGHVS